MKIGEKTLRKGGEILTNAMLTYISKINEAWRNNGEDELKLGLSLIIKPGAAAGNFKLKGDIAFVTEKISDSFSDSVDELQLSLFDKNKDTKICPRDGQEISRTICNNKCPDRLDVILVTGKNGKMPVVLPFNSEVPKLGKNEMIQYRSCAAWADEDYQKNIDAMLSDCDTEVTTQTKNKSNEKVKKAA